MWLYLFVDATRGQRVLWVRIKRGNNESSHLVPIKFNSGAEIIRANSLLQTGRLKNGKISYYGSSFLIALGNLENDDLKSDFSHAPIIEVSHVKTNRFENLPANLVAYTKNLAQVIFSDNLIQLETYEDLDDPNRTTSDFSADQFAVLASRINLNISETFIDKTAGKSSIDCGPIGNICLQGTHVFTEHLKQIATLVAERENRMETMIDFPTFIRDLQSGKVELV